MGYTDIVPALPELLLALSGMALLMFGVFRGDRATGAVAWLAIAAFVGAGFLLAGTPERASAFGNMFVTDRFAVFVKAFLLLGSASSLLLALSYLKREGVWRFEYPVLMVFATLGMFLMVSASHLIALYVGIELQSLSLYVLAAFQRDTERSTEAGLKYFVLGALSSGMLLYGCSLIYGFAGTADFDHLARQFANLHGPVPLGVVIGMVFISAALAFKVSAVPFHMWTPDVYQGAPTPVTAFFAIAPKFAAMALFVRVFVGPFGALIGQWQQVIVAISLLSMVLGAVAGIGQSNVKRLLAYSSIGHVGYALMGLAVGNAVGVRGLLIYLAIYVAMSAGAFGCVLAMRRGGHMVEDLGDLAGLSKSQPVLAAAFAVFMFAMAGIPPFAGFFGKLYVFLAAIDGHLYTLAVVGVLSSAVAAYYYLRIVKLMYFDEPAPAFDRPIGASLTAVLAASAFVTVFFIADPSPLVRAAETAAAALFPG